MLTGITNMLAENWQSIVEILILTVVSYQIYLALHKARNSRIFFYILILLILMTSLSHILKLEVIYWVMKSFTLVLIFSLIVIFQAELRRLLLHLGSSNLFSFGGSKDDTMEDLLESIKTLSQKRHGALIAIEKETSLKEFSETGVILDCVFSLELMGSIFYPKSPLHDGGVILQGKRVLAAACIFPVSQKELNDRTIGLRHRAGLGLTEESDSIALVISEETGNITFCYNGNMQRNLKIDEVKEQLLTHIYQEV